jgi:hypothetical protein
LPRFYRTGWPATPSGRGPEPPPEIDLPIAVLLLEWSPAEAFPDMGALDFGGIDMGGSDWIRVERNPRSVARRDLCDCALPTDACCPTSRHRDGAICLWLPPIPGEGAPQVRSETGALALGLQSSRAETRGVTPGAERKSEEMR